MKAKHMPLSMLLAFKCYFNNKKTYFILSSGIAIAIAMFMVNITLSNYTLQLQIDKTRQITGNWHMAYLYDDDKVLQKVSASNDVENIYTCFYIPTRDEQTGENISFIGIDDSKFHSFIKIDKGTYPNKSTEILVPDWLCSKYDITTFPCAYTFSDTEWVITGTYLCDFFQTLNNIPIYMSYQKNESLQEYGIQALPFGSMVSNDEMPSSEYNKIVLIELKAGTKLRQTINRFKDINGIALFPYSDLYGIFPASRSEGSPWFNGELIGVENIKEAGRLSDEGFYAANQKIHWIYTAIIYAISIVLVLTFFTLKKNEIIRQAGILRVMGACSSQLIMIQLNLIVLVFAFAIPIGTLIGGICVWLIMGVAYVQWKAFALGMCLFFFTVLFPSILYIGNAILGKPLTAISRPTLHLSNAKIVIRKSLLLRSKAVFMPLCYAMRRIRMQKSKVIYTSVAISLLFSMFAICLTQIELLENTGMGKSKYAYDFRIDSEVGSSGPTPQLIAEIKNTSGVESVMCPSTYLKDFADNNSPSLIAKIPRDKIPTLFEKKLLVSQFPYYVQNDKPFIFSDTGVIGVKDDELNYLKEHLIEGSVEPLYDTSSRYVLLPKFFESYQNTDIVITDLSVGDSIEICATRSRDIESLCQEKMLTLKIAGFVDINPFEPTNGVSSEFSVIMNADTLSTLIPSTIGHIYVKANADALDNVQKEFNRLIQDKQGYQIKNAHEQQFHVQMQLLAEQSKNKTVLLMLFSTAFVIALGLGNLFFVQISLQKDELNLMGVIGMSSKTIRIIELLEIVIISVFAIAIGFLFSIFIIKKINDDIMLQQLILVPWNKWILVAGVMTVICLIMSFISLSICEKKH